MKKSSALLGSVAALALCGQAQAGEMKGWYISIDAGANWVQDLSYNINGNTTGGTGTHTHRATAEFETGWAIFAAVGYGIDPNWRVEVEGGYRHNDMDRVVSLSPTTSSSIITTTRPGGELREFSLMANVMYDLPLSKKMSLTLGAGAGFDHAELEDAYWGSDESWNWAYQGILGLNYDVGERSQVFLRYRYFVVPDPEFHWLVNPAIDPLHVCCSDVDDIQKHTATIGFRFFFLPPPVAAAPPPEAPPAPPPTRQFIIFFGFNKCNITAEADRVLSEAASTAKSSGSASVKIVGHTDTSGSAVYNQRLSECRANAAKNNMVDKGIPESGITTSGRGESELMVQTGDGVKEPQNRRATIDVE
jgi:opacity protein-like surface antigen